jgi:predicted acyltransferase
MVMLGILISELFLGDAFPVGRRRKTVCALAVAVLLLIAAAMLAPLGISKASATPTYILICAVAAILAFVALYWICDVRRHVRWAGFARPAGANTLLTYLLPELSFAVFGGAVLIERWNHGWTGVLQAGLFTAMIVAASAILSRFKVRIQL